MSLKIVSKRALAALVVAGFGCAVPGLFGSSSRGVAHAQEAAKPAADPQRLAAAKDLLVAFGGLDQAKASIPQFVDMLVADIKQRDDKIAAPAEYFLRTETEVGKPRVTAYLAEVEAAATQFYAERFTVEEMKAIADFHKSAAGKKFQAETPKLLGLMVPMMGKFQQSLIEDMSKGLSAGAAKEGDAKGDAPKAAAGDKK